VTWLAGLKARFPAPYSGPNSLTPNQETSFTGTLTFYFGLELWHGAALYEVPEFVSETPLSNLHGLGGVIQDFELQKQGSVTPTPYNSRFYLQQTIELGGDREDLESDPMQLGTTVSKRRVVLTVGNMSILDFFDKNSFSGDLRRQFFNMAFLTYAAYDFAADARGYAWGGLAELDYDDWAVRIGRFTPPKDPNGLPIDFRIYKYYGDQVEVEHAHALLGRQGVVRVLGYRNRENMGRFDDAVTAFEGDPGKNAATCTSFHYDSQITTAPDLCWARKPNVKMGLGLNVEQHVLPDAGIFFRGMVSDGQTEVYSYTSTDRSISLGALGQGSHWHRPGDLVGVGYSQGWISKAHANYLNRGGIDGFIGDGKLRQASEHVFEIFYSWSVANPPWVASPFWLSLDYQHIWNPAYNADRGPVNIVSARAHVEF
jgi:hypothetical protein